MKIEYARVSSLGQSLDSLIDKLSAFGCEKVFQEKRSGAMREKRETVCAALEFCREGDVPKKPIEIADQLAPHYPNTPVVFMSGLTENAIIHDGKKDVGSVILQKSIFPFGSGRDADKRFPKRTDRQTKPRN